MSVVRSGEVISVGLKTGWQTSMSEDYWVCVAGKDLVEGSVETSLIKAASSSACSQTPRHYNRYKLAELVPPVGGAAALEQNVPGQLSRVGPQEHRKLARAGK